MCGDNMEKKYIFLILLLLTIGFASVNTVLDLKGSVNFSFDQNYFELGIAKLELNGIEQNDNISSDGQSFTFSAKKNDVLSYSVLNNSLQYDAKVKLSCSPDDDINIIDINHIFAKSTKMKEIIFSNDAEIKCEIIIDKLERTSIANYKCDTLPGTVYNFSYTGSAQEFVTPCDGKYKVELWGAQGGDYYAYNTGGKGSYTSGEIFMNQGESYYIYVGQRQHAYSTPSFNGGKTSSGGATDIRCFYNTSHDKCEKSSNLDWRDDIGLNSRIMVAAGGAYLYNSLTGNIGHGGALIGFNGSNTTGATQTNGGINSEYNSEYSNGGFGYGGNGYGGGSGYYGGAGGINSIGSGGSSFISGYKGCVAILNSDLINNPRTARSNIQGNTCTDTNALDDVLCSFHYSERYFSKSIMKSGTETMPTAIGGTMTGNSNNGYAKITYLGD